MLVTTSVVVEAPLASWEPAGIRFFAGVGKAVFSQDLAFAEGPIAELTTMNEYRSPSTKTRKGGHVDLSD